MWIFSIDRGIQIVSQFPRSTSIVGLEFFYFLILGLLTFSVNSRGFARRHYYPQIFGIPLLSWLPIASPDGDFGHPPFNVYYIFTEMRRRQVLAEA